MLTKRPVRLLVLGERGDRKTHANTLSFRFSFRELTAAVERRAASHSEPLRGGMRTMAAKKKAAKKKKK
jgi:hypothetical protein